MALPVATVANMFEMNVVDCPKLLHNMRRPNPFGAAGIGGWVWCFSVILLVVVLTNVAMFIWNTTQVMEWISGAGIDDPYVKKAIGDPYKWLFFLGVSCIIFAIKWAVATAIPNDPMQVVKHKAR